MHGIRFSVFKQKLFCTTVTIVFFVFFIILHKFCHFLHKVDAEKKSLILESNITDNPANFNPQKFPSTETNYSKNQTIRPESESYIWSRRDVFLGNLLKNRNAHTGVELGVQRGIFSKNLLFHWSNVKQYLLVDAWKPMPYYFDNENVNTKQANNIFKQALQNTAGWNIKVCKNFTSECAKIYENFTFDFIYVDARHDYNGVSEDLKKWFPKLSKNGIISGHDYMTADQQKQFSVKDKWEINGDGTVDITKRAVLGAVDDFFGLKSHPLKIIDIHNNWKTWVVDTAINFDILQIPSTFHFIWVSCKWNRKQVPIPQDVLERIQEWKNMYPTWYIVIWTNDMIQTHFPNLYNLFKKINTGAWVSDVLRYHVIARYGGIYLDTDIVPLRQLPLNLMKLAFTVCQGPRDQDIKQCKFACNAVIGSPPHNPEIQAIANEASQRSLQKIQKYQFSSSSIPYDVGLTGPKLWSQYLNNPNSTITTLSATTFYPCDWKKKQLCNKERYIDNHQVFAMHLWKHSWA